MYKLNIVGDNALIVEWADASLIKNYLRQGMDNPIHALAQKLRHCRIPGLLEVIPAIASLTCVYNPEQITLVELTQKINYCANLDSTCNFAAKPVKKIPVVYGGVYGPDLEGVATESGITLREAIKLHTERQYTVLTLGFLPGFPYMGENHPLLEVPRLPNPRQKVASGSVGLAGWQTGIYPMESPGGWQIIGRTPVKLFDPLRKHPFFLEIGDKLQFYEIEEQEFLKLC